jgi:hypothetical protein
VLVSLIFLTFFFSFCSTSASVSPPSLPSPSRSRPPLSDHLSPAFFPRPPPRHHRPPPPSAPRRALPPARPRPVPAWWWSSSSPLPRAAGDATPPRAAPPATIWFWLAGPLSFPGAPVGALPPGPGSASASAYPCFFLLGGMSTAAGAGPAYSGALKSCLRGD